MANDGKKAATVPVWLVLAVALGGACLFLMPTSAPGPAQAVTVYEKPPVTMESPKALEKLRAKLDAEKAAEKDAASLPKPVVSDRKRKILDQEKAQQAKMAKALEKSAPREDKPKPQTKLPPVKVKKLKPSDDPWASALKPMWGLEHDPTADVVMALGFGSCGDPRAGRRARLKISRHTDALRVIVKLHARHARPRATPSPSDARACLARRPRPPRNPSHGFSAPATTKPAASRSPLRPPKPRFGPKRGAQ